MSDPTPVERTARSAIFTLIGHGAAAVMLPFIIWGATSLYAIRDQLTILQERQAAVISRLDRAETVIERIDAEDVTQGALASLVSGLEIRISRNERYIDDLSGYLRQPR